MKVVAAGSPHPSGLVLQEARRLLVVKTQLQPHAVSLHQSVQNAEAPAERVVARVPNSRRRRSHASGGGRLQEEPTHFLAEPAADDRATGKRLINPVARTKEFQSYLKAWMMPLQFTPEMHFYWQPRVTSFWSLQASLEMRHSIPSRPLVGFRRNCTVAEAIKKIDSPERSGCFIVLSGCRRLALLHHLLL